MACGAFVEAGFKLRALMESSSPKVDAGREMSRPPRAFALTIDRLRKGLQTLREIDSISSQRRADAREVEAMAEGPHSAIGGRCETVTQA
jgi:hypothetical protein